MVAPRVSEGTSAMTSRRKKSLKQFQTFSDLPPVRTGILLVHLS
jgi:hypothetical protein